MLWYFEKNFVGQCTSCNCYNSGELDEFAIFLEKEYGHGILQELNTLFNTPKKWSINELLAVELHYKMLLNGLG